MKTVKQRKVQAPAQLGPIPKDKQGGSVGKGYNLADGPRGGETGGTPAHLEHMRKHGLGGK